MSTMGGSPFFIVYPLMGHLGFNCNDEHVHFHRITLYTANYIRAIHLKYRVATERRGLGARE